MSDDFIGLGGQSEMGNFIKHWAEKINEMLNEANIIHSWEVATYKPEETSYYPKSGDTQLKEIADQIKELDEMMERIKKKYGL